jgi:hypothetical protein
MSTFEETTSSISRTKGEASRSGGVLAAVRLGGVPPLASREVRAALPPHIGADAAAPADAVFKSFSFHKIIRMRASPKS